MTITIKPGTERRVVREADRITLQVKVPPDDQGAAERSLKDLADYLSAMGGGDGVYEPGSEPPSPNFVSDVVAVPGGPFLFADAHQLPRNVLAGLPGWLASALRRQGAIDAVIQVPRFTYNLAVQASKQKNALGLTVYPAAPGLHLPNPQTWLDIAEGWFFGLNSDEKIATLIGAVPVTMPAREARTLLRSLAPTEHVRLARDLGHRVRVVDVTSIAVRRIILAEASHGTEGSNAQLDRFPDMLAILKRYAAIGAYGFVTVDSDLSHISWFLHEAEQISNTPLLVQATLAAQDADRLLVDARPAQIVGPGHLARLVDINQRWIEPVVSDRSLLVLPGEPADWLPHEPGSPARSEYEARMRTYRRALRPVLKEAPEWQQRRRNAP